MCGQKFLSVTLGGILWYLVSEEIIRQENGYLKF